mgnify:CR=1 FL=1
MKKTLTTIIGTAILSGGATFGTITSLAPTSDELVLQEKQKKEAVLKDNIWKSVRLGEIPIWDISVVSQEEMTKAYADLANQKNAIEKENLFDGLRDKATAEGVICKI